MCSSYDVESNRAWYRDAEKVHLYEIDPEYFVGGEAGTIYPGYHAPIIMDLATPEMTMGRWGLVPYWADDVKVKMKNGRPMSTHNARIDRVLKSGMWKKYVNKRCIIPVTGFYEYSTGFTQYMPEGVEKKKSNKYRHAIKPVDEPYEGDPPCFAIAGLYGYWTDPESQEELLTYAMLTTEPNAELGPLHDRSPMILNDWPAIERFMLDQYRDETPIEPATFEPVKDGSLALAFAPK